ncbi:hypothetical protein [Streptomyces sp. URMC 129]|uniref:hypothetical protein n=1 Tax=Streptomyces sp. URMC 129 TaxID=3423407 RepID=UPI003F1AD59F
MTRTRTAVAIVALALALTATACSSDSDDATETDETTDHVTPAYTITSQDNRGTQTYLDVQVDTADGLESVFEAVIADLDTEAGYFVSINCATGSTDAQDNRLANGRYALGGTGAAATGLAEGETEFEPVAGATCPATE